jgi:serine/threonine-protein kinase
MHLALEFVDGFSLAALLKKRPHIAPDGVASIGAAVARGLAHAHERGVVHRNIKPTNILLSRRGEVKIFDFGVAQKSSVLEAPSGLTALRVDDAAAFSTPAYMSPEQILGEAIDGRSDVFSLGVVLYQMICGARPFERSDETDRTLTAQRIRRDPPIPLHRRAPDVPAALERVVMRAIEKSPSDRFPTALAMAERLEELTAATSGLANDRLVVDALAQAGLVPTEEAAAVDAPKRRERASVKRAGAGIVALGVAALVGGAVLQATAHREGLQAGAHPLELVPASPGYLRVLATPWAEVWVDGQRVDVTPFARGIPLTPGTHYVTLVHPSAPVEKRKIAVASGETHTVDVVMAVPELAPGEDAEAPGPRAEREAP